MTSPRMQEKNTDGIDPGRQTFSIQNTIDERHVYAEKDNEEHEHPHKATVALQLHIPDRREVGVNVDKVKESALTLNLAPLLSF